MIDQGGLSSLAPTTPAAVTLTRLHALDMEVILETSLVYMRQDRCYDRSRGVVHHDCCDRLRGIVQPGTNDSCCGHSYTVTCVGHGGDTGDILSIQSPGSLL
jgi:hypothetical protein